MTTELIQLTNQPKPDAAVTEISVAPTVESETRVVWDAESPPTPHDAVILDALVNTSKS